MGGVVLLVPRTHAPLAATAAAGAPLAAPAGTAIPMEQPAAAHQPARPHAQLVEASAGITLAQLASLHHSDEAAIRWANALPGDTEPAAGSALLLPPGPGALVPVQPGERPSRLAARLAIPLATLLDYNRLDDDSPQPAGAYLQVPAAAAPAGSLPSEAVKPAARGIPEVDPAQLGVTPDGRFPYGQCTWWVSQKRLVPWNGDAGTWYDAARAAGRPVGQLPVAGAIAVFATGWVGHVAFVQSVNPDGSFVISEMNVAGWGVVDTRTITVSSSPMYGFVY